MDFDDIEIKSPFESDFWTEWVDDRKLLIIPTIISMTLVLFILFIVTLPTELQRGIIYLSMIILASVIGIIDLIGDQIFNKKQAEGMYFQWVAFGKSVPQALVALGVGTGLGFLMTSNSYSILTPLSTATGFNIASLGSTTSAFIYICLLAPYVEEKFFRGVTLPTAANVFRQAGLNRYMAGWVGLAFQAVAFGFMHWVAYGASPQGIMAAIAFGVIAGVGNYITQSVLFGLGLHFINNLVAFNHMGG
jgi:membrane protease YdiL (CAAX protease family)